MNQLYAWYGWNLRLFHLINSAHGPVWDAAMRTITRFSDHRDFATYVAAVCLLGSLVIARGLIDGEGEMKAFHWFSVVWVLALGYVIDQALVTMLKEWFSLPRPDAILPSDQRVLLGPPRFNGSFPSGHVIFASLLVASIWPVAHPWGRVAGALFLMLVCISRVSLGMHFPADVVWGVIFGVSVPLLLRRSLRALWQYVLPSESEMP